MSTSIHRCKSNDEKSFSITSPRIERKWRNDATSLCHIICFWLNLIWTVTRIYTVLYFIYLPWTSLFSCFTGVYNLKGLCLALRYLFNKLKLFSHYFNSKNNSPRFGHWNCSLLSVVTNSKDGHGLKLVGPTLLPCLGKSSPKILWLMLPAEICLISYYYAKLSTSYIITIMYLIYDYISDYYYF